MTNVNDGASSEPEALKRSRKPLVLTIGAVALVLALWWTYGTVSYRLAHESTDDAQVDGHIVPVIAKVGGYVSAVNAVENDSVAEGYTLVTIEASEYRLQLAKAEAELAAAEAMAGGTTSTGQAQSQVSSAESQHSAVESQLDVARAEAGRARSDLARGQRLAASEIISRQQLDALATAVEVAEARVSSAERQVLGAGASVTSAQAGVRLASARFKAALAERDHAALQLGYTTIVAPATGVVSRKSVEIGQLVQPGQPLMAIVADTGIWITANFKETQLVDLRVGQPVEIDVDAYSGCKAEGMVESISSATGAKFALLPPDNATGNFTKVVQRVPVRITITKGCGPEQPLRLGMSLNVAARTK